MTGRERYQRILIGKPVDSLPVTPILMQYAAEYIGSDYAAFASDYRVLVKANEACAQAFGIDQVSCISDPYRETEGFGATITYRPDGPPHSTHPLESDRDLNQLASPHPFRSKRMRDRIQAAAAFKAGTQGRFSILGWIEGPAAEAADLRNVTPFLMDLLDAPRYAGELMDRCVAVGIDFARAQVEAGADTIGIGDAIVSQIDPHTFETLIQPREKRLVKAIQAMGAFVKLHICGNITHLLAGIADLGVDILDVDHAVDLARVRQTVGPRVALTGNLDPVGVVQNGTPEAIHVAVRNAYAQAGDPYMVNAGCEIPAGTPRDNLAALCRPIPVHP